MSDKDTVFILNDLLDAVERLADIIHELNPGADLGSIGFLIHRAADRLETVSKQIEEGK